MEQEVHQQFNQLKQSGKMKNLISIGIINFAIGALITGGIVYFVLNNSYLTKQKILNNQISSLQDKINAFEKQSKIVKISPNPTKSSTNDAVINKGWKKFISNGGFVYSTNDWYSYSSKNYNTSFSIEYPTDWSLRSGVFHDANGEKIAEFIPGLVILKPGQKCFDAGSSNKTGDNEIISQTNTTINQLNGVLRIEKVFYEGGSPNLTGYWYPNTYCLSNGNYAFVMSFYEKQLNSDKRKLFQKIISTLKFE